ncbi:MULTISPECIES: VolA/Pla-1 family phospholipase [Gammaproteobacteria]|uniref:VolA/Pla-1 family phospholipase n=1 Tax=Gammaproteobacteria TaxID=1236 RepID=UPI000DCF7161|nr:MULTISPECIES: VolA/Pla-1 family phospholipase [Gammaproteobacteria]RTE86026.1 alpha/beta hydrolase [Aliidiomarina sp. B3213]TCZ91380.1 alpha/beta hydrolase [Lysobacter sp. N42]
MKKLLLSLSVASALGLTGCLSDGTDAPVTDEEINSAAVRVVFDPGLSKISLPNDILLGGTTDGTLNIPVDDPTDYADPQVALGTLDGWSTAMPQEFGFDLATDEFGETITVDSSSVTAAGGIRVFQAVMGGDTSVEECTSVPQGAVCTIVAELTHGEDFTVAWSNGRASVVPLVPFLPKTGYVVALTDSIVDSLGRSIKPSTTYFTLSKPLSTDPIGGAQEQALQGIINSQRGALASAGVDVETIVHTKSYTTQSVGDVLGVVKQLMLQPALAPQLTAGPTGMTVADALIGAGQLPNDPTNPNVAIASSADLYAGTVTLPYFSAIPTAENPGAPLTGRWQATAVSPAAIQIGLNSGAITQEELAATLVGLGLDPAVVLANPANLAGAIPYEAAPVALYNPDYDATDPDSVRGLDQERLLTKYNPIPRPSTVQTVPLRMSVPNVAVVNAVRAQQGLDPIAEPAGGWPVVIFQHGITGSKENFLAIAGTLAVFGQAAVAIDHPLHGERGFPGGINATSGQGSPTNYLNLASLLTARDNLRQSVSDLLGLRLSLSNGAANFGGANINGMDVSFVGHSLGAITGHNFVALANTGMTGDAAAADPLYSVEAAALGMPGGGIAPFLVESQSFGNLIGGLLAFQSFDGFQAYALEEATNSGIVPGLDNPQFLGAVAQYYAMYYGGIATDAEIAARDSLLAQFQFAAQSIVDPGDPINYARALVATETPTFLIEAIGDATIPNSTAHPLGGTEPLIRLLGLQNITTAIVSQDGEPLSGAARYINGGHGGLLDPSDDAATTANQQQAIGVWLQSNQLMLPVDPSLVPQ